jgi:hypothetical protein
LKKIRPFAVLLAAFVLALCCAVPARDLPETRYDESQKQPFQAVTLDAAQGLQQLIQASRPSLKSGLQFISFSPIENKPTGQKPPEWRQSSLPISAAARSYALRC